MAFIWAARLFAPRASDILISIFEAGAVLFTTLLVTFEIRSFFQDGVIGYGSFSFVEQATQILGWLGLALGLFWINRKRGRPVFTWGWRLLGGLALLCLALGPLTLKNPIWHPVAVGDWYFWNLLALGYLAPALLLGFGAWLLRHFGEESTGTRIAWITAGLSSLLLLFAWSSLELRCLDR